MDLCGQSKGIILSLISCLSEKHQLIVDVSHLGFCGHATHNVSLLIIVKIHFTVIWVIRNGSKVPSVLLEITYIIAVFKSYHVYTTKILQMMQTSSRELNCSLTFKFPSNSARQYKPVNSNQSPVKCRAPYLIGRR